MAVYRGPRCRQCRREGTKLMLKGERCKTEKCAIERRPFPPGMRVSKRRRAATEYNNQLREKQKIRRIYGVLENQFRLYFKAASNRPGVTGENLLQLLELRLDNIVYRLGLAPSRSSARQLVLHNHLLINGKKVNVPSYRVKEGDTIQVKEKSNNLELIHSSLKGLRDIPDWLSIDKVKLTGQVVRVPDRASIPVNVEEQLVVELYSR
ncbi:30S ribosomal protein S4 [Chitinispirillales bacterium ANBcel5]|uniref:30S ribosomal protein S4 n=1 Tax=Cellulosispirillum alkaliphilum TaxID=3039283 RepID=UPI002A529227|nr:30S ribosomal protein S4 [Chitinispirillales bacterium ANBcel5]